MTICKEDGVSDVIGVLLLISIATISLGIVGVELISQVSVTDIPQTDLSIIWQEDPDDNIMKPYVVFERGEPIEYDNIKILIDEKDVKSDPDMLRQLEIKKPNSGKYESWKDKVVDGKIVSFSIGDSIKWNSEDAKVISIVFSQAGKEILLLSGKNPFVDNYSI